MKPLRLNQLYLLIAVAVLSTGLPTQAQQQPDTSFTYPIPQPAYPMGKGPLILIDGTHYNFHTREAGFSPFARLMEGDGYRVEGIGYRVKGVGYQVSGIRDVISESLLKGCRILIIANALNEVNEDNWTLPTPSAFSKSEIDVIRDWVSDGGSLLLIADHMPFAGAASELGLAFGFEFVNGFADLGQNRWPPSVFRAGDGSLKDSTVSRGLKPGDRIDSVASFTGSAFRAPSEAIPVLTFTGMSKSLLPDTAWKFNDKTPSVKLDGYCQGAILQFGKGRVAVFGEAAMFTAQLVNGNFRVGINSEAAPQNAQFALNLVHWLDSRSDRRGK
jgi:hypothetical protein